MFCFSFFESFVVGPNPTTHRRTLVPLKLQSGGETFPDDPKSWGLRLDRKIPSSNDILLQVHIAPDASVGIWSCTVNEKKVMRTTTRIQESLPLALLFYLVRRRNIHSL